MSETHDLFAACQPGLEPLLVRELQALGAAPRTLPGGAAFRGDVALAMRACLWLGTASHVLLRLREFPCRALGELQRKAALLPWQQWLRPNVPVEVRASTRGSRVYHTGAIVERVENAIAAALTAPLRRPTGEQDLVAHVHARFHGDVCTLSLDTACTPLHRRGYRLETAKAPLREDLAHALVLASGWTPAHALLDPFAGSGTIAIEAAGLALGLPPGRLRPPALHHLALFDAATWLEVAQAPTPRKAAASQTMAKVAASDRDAGAIEAARHNAERAGVAGHVTFGCHAVTAHPWLAPGAAPPQGVLVTNPPFGVRVQHAENLLSLYQTIGHRTARLGPGWRVAILAHDVRLARRTGLPLLAAFTTKHGGLTVTALVGEAAAVTSEESR
ncbi:MAG TPA: class I SAM-dependent RNA methyltransferase [Planctomycetota bacterium]|nr:class I SAM-dependent RNA methyltransferase [Planctomycetota bacterium]